MHPGGGWGAGCEEAVLDLAEGILKVIEAFDIVFWPVALDFKKGYRKSC